MQISFSKLRVAVWLAGLLVSAGVSATAEDELGIVRVTDSPDGIAVPATGVGYIPLGSAFDDGAVGIQRVSATVCDSCPTMACSPQCGPDAGSCSCGDCQCSADGCGSGCGCGVACCDQCDDCIEMKPVKIYTLEHSLHKIFNGCSRFKCWVVNKCNESRCCQWWHCQSSAFIARNRHTSEALCNAITPQGNCGEGVAVVGHYKMTYAVQPDYFDQRDGQLYSAQGYGIPVTVPLAPNVRHTYNYGWGIPSSRLTPVSHPAGQ